MALTKARCDDWLGGGELATASPAVTSKTLPHTAATMTPSLATDRQFPLDLASWRTPNVSNTLIANHPGLIAAARSTFVGSVRLGRHVIVFRNTKRQKGVLND